jgi:hypothetical protein
MMMKKQEEVNDAVPSTQRVVAKYPTQTTTERAMRLKLRSKKPAPLVMPQRMTNEVSPTSTS